jgi:putative peptide zinc metalloprotease protein
VPALFLIPPHWPELTNNFSDRVLSVDNLVVLYLIFPLTKALHELGHASATKASGGEVHDLGVVLLVLLPVPYVEASAASVFKSKYRRALVGAAGVIAELFLAAIAFYLWLLVEPGIVRAALFNVMLIACVSTLVFNGNPLLRYDAYYILADLTEIPNLAARSGRYWGYLIERYLLGIREMEPPDASRGEKAWFFFYGVASTIYRIMVTILIALFIAGRFLFIGVLLAIWAVSAMAIFPVARAINHLVRSPRLQKNRARAGATAAILATAVAGFLLFVPVPHHSHAEGVLWLPEEALVRAGANGFFADFLAAPGTLVHTGELLLRSEDPSIAAQVRRGEAKVAEVQAEYNSEFVKDQAKAQVVMDRLEGERKGLEIARTRAADLIVAAHSDGIFTVTQTGDMPGRYYRKGDLLGHVIGKVHALARVIITQDAVDFVRLATDRVEVRRVDEPGIVLQGRITREVPAAAEYLPSPALAVEGGGSIVVDPRDTKGPKALQRVFQIDVELEDPAVVTHFGQRVFVRFEHPKEPLAIQLYRAVRLLFLSSFNV